jgi:hypothetical protein
MSQNVDPAKSRLWVDGDAFRAPAGTTLPTTNLFTAATFTGWDPYGAIKAGFEVTKDQENSNLTAWNAKGTYRKKRGEVIKNVALRPVDESKATIMTLLQGGSVSETAPSSGIWELIPGDDEEFALLLICRDPGFGSKAYYIERGTLDNLPNEVINDDDLNGYDLVITALEPEGGGLAVRTFADSNPLASS